MYSLIYDRNNNPKSVSEKLELETKRNIPISSISFSKEIVHNWTRNKY